jgi:cohesin complex subunit SA-1/2
MWNDINRQFLRHTDPTVLREVVSLVRKMNNTTALEATNHTKFDELKTSLSNTLQDVLANKDLAIDSLEDEELQNIGSGLLRVRTLMAQYNVESLFAAYDDEDVDRFDLFDILIALASRGKLGYRSEVEVSRTTSLSNHCS